MPRKILIFSLAYYPSHVSGAEAAIYEITNRIDPSDIEFHLVTLLFDTNASREEQIGNTHVHRIGFGGAYISKIIYIPLAAWTARRLHKTVRFDAMWSVMTYMLLPVVLAKLLGVRVPHLLTLQDGDPYDKVFNRWFVKPVVPLLNHGLRTAESIQAISSYLAQWPKKHDSRVPVELIYNGANPRDIKAKFDQTIIENLRKELKKEAGDILLINTARLVHQKAFDDIIRALPNLPEYVKLIIVGDGPEEESLKHLANKLGVRNRIFFVGSVDRSVVSNYRQVADIFVGPSRSEGLGNAFLSAMASRLPVVATHEGGLAEFVFDGETAWVIEKDSPEQIVKAVKDILENPEKVERITENARTMVLKKFDWDVIARKMRIQFFGKVVGK